MDSSPSDNARKEEGPPEPLVQPQQIISADDVCCWLQRLGLSQYVSVFRDNEIDGNDLLGLSHEDLQFIGVKKYTDRKAILLQVQQIHSPRNDSNYVVAAPLQHQAGVSPPSSLVENSSPRYVKQICQLFVVSELVQIVAGNGATPVRNGPRMYHIFIVYCSNICVSNLIIFVVNLFWCFACSDHSDFQLATTLQHVRTHLPLGRGLFVICYNGTMNYMQMKGSMQ